MVAAISVQDLTKTYPGGTQALKGVSLSIQEGDFFGLLGPNGAGKTTLISILTGLVPRSSGQALIFGHDIGIEPVKAKAFLGVVPQEFNFNIFEKVQNIVLDQAGYYGISRNAARGAAEKYLHALGLWEQRDEKAQHLSGGMKRRLMIARALTHEPRILILDEPTAGVDIELRRGMWDFLKKLNNEGRTIILTTHYLEEAEQLSRHIAIIHGGQIAEAGSVKELLSKLQQESFLLDLDREADDRVIDLIRPHVALAARADSNTLEVALQRTQHLNGVFEVLSRNTIHVKSMRTKSNRLEELFVSIIGQKNGAPP